MSDQPILDSLAGVKTSVLTVDHLGLPIHVRIWGDTSRPVVVLQHGGKDHGRSWDYVIARLLDRFCCVVPDLRGHGDSGWPTGGGFNMFDMVADFAVVVDAIRAEGLEGPYRLIGHSAGGAVVLQYAAARPEAVLLHVNIEGLGFHPDRYQGWLDGPAVSRWVSALDRRRRVLSGRRPSYSAIGDAADRLAKVHPTLDRSMVDYLAAHGVRKEEGGFVWKHDPSITFTAISPQPPKVMEKAYAAIKAPTVLFYGGKSLLGPFERSDARFSMFDDVTLNFYDDAGHWLHHENVDRFMDDLNPHLDASLG